MSINEEKAQTTEGAASASASTTTIVTTERPEKTQESPSDSNVESNNINISNDNNNNNNNNNKNEEFSSRETQESFRMMLDKLMQPNDAVNDIIAEILKSTSSNCYTGEAAGFQSPPSWASGSSSSIFQSSDFASKLFHSMNASMPPLRQDAATTDSQDSKQTGVSTDLKLAGTTPSGFSFLPPPPTPSVASQQFVASILLSSRESVDNNNNSNDNNNGNSTDDGQTATSNAASSSEQPTETETPVCSDEAAETAAAIAKTAAEAAEAVAGAINASSSSFSSLSYPPASPKTLLSAATAAAAAAEHFWKHNPEFFQSNPAIYKSTLNEIAAVGGAALHDVFCSEKWAQNYQPNHQDLPDFTKVFLTEVTKSSMASSSHPQRPSAAGPASTRPAMTTTTTTRPSSAATTTTSTPHMSTGVTMPGTDWLKEYERQLPPASLPAAPSSTFSSMSLPTPPPLPSSSSSCSRSMEAAQALTTLTSSQTAATGTAAITTPMLSEAQAMAATAAAAVAAATTNATTGTTATGKRKRPPRKRKMDEAPAEREFVEPTDQDVLLGRGGRSNHHPGNKLYLQDKELIQDKYLKAEKAEKTKISQELVDIVHKRGGRFVKLDDEGPQSTNKWYVVSATEARKKASQTLREINTAEQRALKRQKYSKH